MLTTRSENALRFLASLAKLPNGSMKTLQEIAEEEELPHAYLEQILPSLKKAGIVISQRGAYGGYKLARPSDEISTWEVIQAVEKKIQKNKETGCPFTDHLLSGLRSNIKKHLEKVSLAGFIDV